MFKIEGLKITAIVPVYNNQKTIKRVIKILLGCDFLSKVIAVNDCSKDKSLNILQAFKNTKFQLINLPHNYGKASAINRALVQTKTPVVMNIDADLARLKKSHIVNLKNAFFQTDADLVIAARQNKFNSFLKRWLLDPVAGERIFFKKNIEPVRFLLCRRISRGYEQVINFAHKDKKIKVIYAHNTGHIMKYNLWRGWQMYKIILAYLQEISELIKTAFLIKFYSLMR